jgi:regulation of enolase protein 1 (concanavalin A-like superfamily)
MPRIAALLLCALAALVATATPVPDSKPWVTGWDKPVDPKGDCRFKRKGERLTITVPGEGHQLDLWTDRFDAPRFLRDVKGDFVVEVRVSGDCWSAKKEDGSRGAGILLLDKGNNLAVELGFIGQPDDTQSNDTWGVVGRIRCAKTMHRLNVEGGTSPPRDSCYLRLERRGDLLRMSCSKDGREWKTPSTATPEQKLPWKLKVGVFAEANAEGEFKVTFEKFKLSRPGN